MISFSEHKFQIIKHSLVASLLSRDILHTSVDSFPKHKCHFIKEIFENRLLEMTYRIFVGLNYLLSHELFYVYHESSVCEKEEILWYDIHLKTFMIGDVDVSIWKEGLLHHQSDETRWFVAHQRVNR